MLSSSIGHLFWFLFVSLKRILKQVSLQKPFSSDCPQTFLVLCWVFFFSAQVTFKHILTCLKKKKEIPPMQRILNAVR